MLPLVILASLIGGVLSLIGGAALLFNKKIQKYSIFASAFAAGALLAASFLDLLPEALHSGDSHQILLFTLIAIISFLVLENFLYMHAKGAHSKTLITMLAIGDTLHNFVDGAAIAAGFLISPATGFIVTLAVALHEIPQEIGDFGVMMNRGLSRHKILAINLFSALASTLSAIIFYLIGSSIEINLSVLLAIVAGFFLYISMSGLIPLINSQNKAKTRNLQLVWLLAGLLVVGLAVTNLHHYIDQGHDHDSHLEEDHSEHDHE